MESLEKERKENEKIRVGGGFKYISPTSEILLLRCKFNYCITEIRHLYQFEGYQYRDALRIIPS